MVDTVNQSLALVKPTDAGFGTETQMEAVVASPDTV